MALTITSYIASACGHGVLNWNDDGVARSLVLVKEEAQELAAKVALISPYGPKLTLLLLWIVWQMNKGKTFNQLIGKSIIDPT